MSGQPRLVAGAVRGDCPHFRAEGLRPAFEEEPDVAGWPGVRLVAGVDHVDAGREVRREPLRRHRRRPGDRGGADNVHDQLRVSEPVGLAEVHQPRRELEQLPVLLDIRRLRVAVQPDRRRPERPVSLLDGDAAAADAGHRLVVASSLVVVDSVDGAGDLPGGGVERQGRGQVVPGGVRDVGVAGCAASVTMKSKALLNPDHLKLTTKGEVARRFGLLQALVTRRQEQRRHVIAPDLRLVAIHLLLHGAEQVAGAG